MAKLKSHIRRRRRKSNPDARRRQTTRAGRAGIIDRGPERLRELRLLATGSQDLPVDPLAILLGRDLLGEAAYNAGRDIGELLSIVARSFGAGFATTWRAILAGGAIHGSRFEPLSGPGERALRILARYSLKIGDPGIAALVFAVCAGEFYPFRLRFIERAVLRSMSARDYRAVAMVRSSLELIAALPSRRAA